jgi:hypothetical protein
MGSGLNEQKRKRYGELKKWPKNQLVQRILELEYSPVQLPVQGGIAPVMQGGKLLGFQTNDKFYGDFEMYDELYGINGRILSPHGEHIGWRTKTNEEYIRFDIVIARAMREMEVTLLMMAVIMAAISYPKDMLLAFLRRMSGKILGAYKNYCDFNESIGQNPGFRWTEEESIILPIEIEKHITTAMKEGDFDPLKQLAFAIRDEVFLDPVQSVGLIYNSGRFSPENRWLVHNIGRVKSELEAQGRESQLRRDVLPALLLLLDKEPQVEDWTERIRYDIQNAITSSDDFELFEDRLDKAIKRQK